MKSRNDARIFYTKKYLIFNALSSCCKRDSQIKVYLKYEMNAKAWFRFLRDIFLVNKTKRNKNILCIIHYALLTHTQNISLKSKSSNQWIYYRFLLIKWIQSVYNFSFQFNHAQTIKHVKSDKVISSHYDVDEWTKIKNKNDETVNGSRWWTGKWRR